MKKLIVLIVSVFVLHVSYGQIQVFNDGEVSIGSSIAPDCQLEVRGDQGNGQSNTGVMRIYSTNSSYSNSRLSFMSNIMETGEDPWSETVIYAKQGNAKHAAIFRGNVFIHPDGAENDMWIYNQVWNASNNLVFTSDKRIKNNIRPIENSLSKINLLNAISYDYSEDYYKKMWLYSNYGLITTGML